MSEFQNQTGVSLSVAVYLATDHYDYVPDAISATGLLKPVRATVLSRRVPAEQQSIDVIDVFKSRLGTSIHDGIEKVWTGDHYKQAMRKLGYTQKVVDRIVVNPADILTEAGYDIEALEEADTFITHGTSPKDAIPVFMEIRGFREIDGQKISGKFDFAAEGRIEDFKSTSTFTFTHQTKVGDYKLQGSIYRWLHPKIITEDHIHIQYLFTDWMAGKAKNNPNYPQSPTIHQSIPLLSLEETEQFVRTKLSAIQRFIDSPQDNLPACTDEELWRKPPSYKYYKNPKKMTRSTKNYTTPQEAYRRLADDGNVGLVVEKSGEVVACRFCPAASVCTQKERYILDGSLVM